MPLFVLIIYTFIGLPRPSSRSRGKSGIVVHLQLLSLIALKRIGILSSGPGTASDVYRTYKDGALENILCFLRI